MGNRNRGSTLLGHLKCLLHHLVVKTIRVEGGGRLSIWEKCPNNPLFLMASQYQESEYLIVHPHIRHYQDYLLTLRVECRGCLIEEQDRGIPHLRSKNLSKQTVKPSLGIINVRTEQQWPRRQKLISKGFPTMALAMATLCFCPPESWVPFPPT